MAIRALTQAALAGIEAQTERFEGAAARATRLADAPSAAESAETVQVSPEARRASENLSGALSTGIEGAMVDLRVAKYAFMASLSVLKTGAEVDEAAAAILPPRR